MQGTNSLAESLASLTPSEQRRVLRGLPEQTAAALLTDWRVWARPSQLNPRGDWLTWALIAGRGFGKTRSGTGWTHERAMAAPRHMALAGRTPADVRDYMIEGPGGYVRNCPRHEAPRYEPSKRRLTWPNGTVGTIYSGEDPEAVRGFSGDTFWLDEFAKFSYPEEFWDNLQFGMREASIDQPRGLITTTPRPLAILKKILALPDTIKVQGSSYDNRRNLDPRWYARTIAPYEGTRMGRQEIYAEILDDIPGALFSRDMIERNRIREAPTLGRIVIAIDPSGAETSNEDETGNAIGIVAAGVDPSAQVGYILNDWTLTAGPAEWAQRAVDLYRKHSADRIVAEVNYGGAMVEAVIRAIDPNIAYRKVRATRGKVVRAEPVAALGEKNRIKFVGGFAELEDELCAFTTTGYVGGASPNRADAMVWAIFDLMLNNPDEEGASGMPIIIT